MIRRLALLIWLIPLALNAQMDPALKATEIARGVMGGDQFFKKTRYVQDSVIPIGNPDIPSVFVVTYKPAGFVIVSARETDTPVLGYSLNSSFPVNPDHPLRSWLLPTYEVSAGRQPSLKTGLKAQYSTDHIVLPLTSAQWGQGDPWNRFCPADSTGKRALAGCVAVAMSQIMEKWHWPSRGYGEVSYTPLQHPEYGEITANFDTTNYRWDLTHDQYPTDAAALILYHTGVSTFMNYDPALSSTSVDRYAVPALIYNFLYNKAMVFREMEGNISDEWIRLLHQELDNSRPVLYAGTSPNGKSSHAFNVDGYRNDTYFHFNWGWNGAGDGWYTLAGMAGGGADFSTQQGAIFGLQPAGMPLHDRPSSLDILAGDGFIQLFWEQPVITDFSNFNIYRNGIKIGQTANTQFRDEGVVNGQTYHYEVTAWYQGENSGESDAAPVVTAIPWIQMEPGYVQTFESGPTGWQLQDSTSGFRISNSDTLQFDGNLGRFAAIRSEGHAAGVQVSDYLTSPVIFPGKYSHTAISFDYLFRQKPGIDKFSLLWRDFNTGEWETLVNLDSTGGYSNWKNLHFYLPETPADTPIQLAFYYNDFFGEGYGAAIDNFTVYEVNEPAVPDLSISQSDICLDQSVIFSDQSVGQIQTWEWDFGEDAEPRYATTQGPHLVSYTKSGKKTIKLSLNHLDHLAMPDTLLIRDKPVAGFEYTRRFQDILFTSKAEHAEQLLWIFGDGTTSEETNPVHTYYTKSLFEVRQIAYNGICQPDTMTISVDLRNGTGIDDGNISANLRVFPNPTHNKVTLAWENFTSGPVNIRILSPAGQMFFIQEYPSLKELEIDLSDFPDGLYILQIASGKMIRNEHIIKIK